MCPGADKSDAFVLRCLQPPASITFRLRRRQSADVRRNWLFAGSDAGGNRAAGLYSILQTAKLNDVNAEAYLTDTLARIADGHPINRIVELSWAYQSTPT